MFQDGENITHKETALTMASPQIELGHTDISNELLIALARADLKPCEWRVLLSVIVHTYSKHRKSSTITVKQIRKLTRLTREEVLSCKLTLLNKNMLLNSPDGSVGIQKDYETWHFPGCSIDGNDIKVIQLEEGLFTAISTVESSSNAVLLADDSADKPVSKRMPPAYTEDFEVFFKAYPRREGKALAFSHWNHILAQKLATKEQMVEAARNFAKYCRLTGKHYDVTLMASSFIGPEKEPYKAFVGLTDREIKERASLGKDGRQSICMEAAQEDPDDILDQFNVNWSSVENETEFKERGFKRLE